MFSMKSSNPKVMIEAYRLLVARLEQEGPDWNYPIHLGVTEAGDGEDGRIKSAIGIGSLLGRRHRRHDPGFTHRRFSVTKSPSRRVIEPSPRSTSLPQDASSIHPVIRSVLLRNRRAHPITVMGEVKSAARNVVRVCTTQQNWNTLGTR